MFLLVSHEVGRFLAKELKNEVAHNDAKEHIVANYKEKDPRPKTLRHISRTYTTTSIVLSYMYTTLLVVGPCLQDVATGGNWGFFYSAPQDFVVLGVFCARFPPREANIPFFFLKSVLIKTQERYRRI